MTSSDVTPKRKRLKLSRKAKEEEDEETASNVLTKSDTKNCEIRKRNFIKACLKVSFDAYRDFRKRFQLIYLPECINNNCHHVRSTVNIEQISLSAQQSFKTEIKNNAWYEALEICLVCITSTKYLSANVLKDIVEIMMNAHEDLSSGYPVDYLLQKCQQTLMINFNMHPPCIAKNLRDCYKEFLTTRMDQRESSNRKVYLSDEGIVSHCFSRLAYEITLESNDGALIEEQDIPADMDGVKLLHWKKENSELFELLVRTERIERCMLVLESIIYLLQTDLALCHSRNVESHNTRRSHKPLLLHLMGPTTDSNRKVIITPLCQKMIQLFAYFIHLQYPQRHIKTMSLWMNAVVQMFYMLDPFRNLDYPTTQAYCAEFAREFYKVISPLPATSILRILENLQPSFMQHLVGLYYLQTILHYGQCDILNIINSCLTDMSWDNYPVGGQPTKKPTNCKITRVKPHKLMDYLSRKCKNSNVIEVPTETYAKLELNNNNSQICQDHILQILSTTFVAYLETYSIKHFKQTLEIYNENGNNNDPPSPTSYILSDSFVKNFRTIVENLKELIRVLNNRQNDDRAKLFLDLLNVYIS